jgi:hypothetical protein
MASGGGDDAERLLDSLCSASRRTAIGDSHVQLLLCGAHLLERRRRLEDVALGSLGR